MNLKTTEKIPDLPAGSPVFFSGKFLTMRDGTLKKYFSENPDDDFLRGKIIYFCGPTPAPPGKIIGAAGPTTSARMEKYFEKLGKSGVAAIIEKGEISAAAREILQKEKIKYFAAFGGAGAFLATKITAASVKKFPELGAEAIFELSVENFPAIFWGKN